MHFLKNFIVERMKWNLSELKWNHELVNFATFFKTPVKIEKLKFSCRYSNISLAHPFKMQSKNSHKTWVIIINAKFFIRKLHFECYSKSNKRCYIKLAEKLLIKSSKSKYSLLCLHELLCNATFWSIFSWYINSFKRKSTHSPTLSQCLIGSKSNHSYNYGRI